MSLAIHDDLDRSASPPGRETREDWRPSGGGDGASRNGRSRSPPSSEKRRSRSRSPLRKSGRDSSPTREWRYIRDGTNTTSREPHLERARLFVGNIDANRTHRRDLIKLFSCYGDVMGVSIHKGYAFVQMDRERTANKAINYEDNRVFMGAQIRKLITLFFGHLEYLSPPLLPFTDVEFSQAALKAGAKCKCFFSVVIVCIYPLNNFSSVFLANGLLESLLHFILRAEVWSNSFPSFLPFQVNEP